MSIVLNTIRELPLMAFTVCALPYKKVETVGDCYVGVAGLPEPRDDHAAAAAKFAKAILNKFRDLTQKLEVALGPDTADLGLRIGLHSGQVTAGVLRGERARFQLFGDTVNTAARMESTGERGRIHLSPATADLLDKDGKSSWVKPRRGTVAVKGKGEIQTYWLETNERLVRRLNRKNPSTASGLTEANGIEMAPIDEADEIENEMDVGLNDNLADTGFDRTSTKTHRLVEWNLEILKRLLQQIVAAREDFQSASEPLSAAETEIGAGATVLEEFQPIISLKRFDVATLDRRKDPDTIDLGEEAVEQLRDYLTTIAGMYRNNSFHNFEHASHVTASVRKLLSRIVSVHESGLQISTSNPIHLVDLAGHSYGITSDPLTQFAVVFSAVIHDVDHPGVPNVQLIKEGTRSAQIYQKSIAEQNSVDLAWELLMSPDYVDLRACIYSTQEELKRFRQLVVNTVMATDICDKELQALRKARWETAFSSTQVDPTPEIAEDRKATIVIEHLIQASDVAHTMQHWQVYRQWNEKFFMEMYGAYKAGRAETDPSEGWYKGEIGFFDFYVIPLAKKLETCGVFGVSSLEYLNYAMSNRDEWIREGEKAITEYIEKYDESQVRGPQGTAMGQYVSDHELKFEEPTTGSCSRNNN